MCPYGITVESRSIVGVKKGQACTSLPALVGRWLGSDLVFAACVLYRVCVECYLSFPTCCSIEICFIEWRSRKVDKGEQSSRKCPCMGVAGVESVEQKALKTGGILIDRRIDSVIGGHKGGGG